MSFWNNLPKPFFVMAPMADVTDVAFRALVAARGAPDVFWTEFVSADGLYHTREIQKISDAENPLMRNLAFGENQRPIVAQIFSSKPEMIAYAVRLVAELGFDGVDINMGCPDRTIEKQGAGAALVKNPVLAVELIRAAREASELPVSVKTRIGYNKESLDEWLAALLLAGPAAITLHLRTRKEMSLVPADWELMKKRWKFAIISIPTCFLSATAMHKTWRMRELKFRSRDATASCLAARCSATPGYLKAFQDVRCPLRKLDIGRPNMGWMKNLKRSLNSHTASKNLAAKAFCYFKETHQGIRHWLRRRRRATHASHVSQ